MPNKVTWYLLGVEACVATLNGHGEDRREGPAVDPSDETSDGSGEGFETSWTVGCVELAVEKKMINKHNGMVVYLIAYK